MDTYSHLRNLITIGLNLTDATKARVVTLAAVQHLSGMSLAAMFLFRPRRPNGAEMPLVPPPERPKLLEFRVSLIDFAREVSRARRYPHPLAVIVLRPEPRTLPAALQTLQLRPAPVAPGPNGNGSKPSGNGARRNGTSLTVALPLAGSGKPRAGRNGHDRPEAASGPPRNGTHEALQMFCVQVGSLLRDNVRELDIATYDDANRQFVLLLPETDRARAQDACRRLEDLVHTRTGTRLRSGIAELHADGLIVEDLVRCAMQECDGPPGAVRETPAPFDAGTPQH